jgi:hypothetical protein
MRVNLLSTVPYYRRCRNDMAAYTHLFKCTLRIRQQIGLNFSTALTTSAGWAPLHRMPLEPAPIFITIRGPQAHWDSREFKAGTAETGALPRTDGLAAITRRRRGGPALCANSPKLGAGAVNKKREKVRDEIFGSAGMARLDTRLT